MRLNIQAMTTPNLPIPAPLRGSDPNSFAHYTVSVRLPNIVEHVLQENNLAQPIVRQLRRLIEEISAGRIRYLNDAEAPDAGRWVDYLKPFVGSDWFQIPWFLAETYFYRRILEATGYFKSGPGYHLDPFIPQKQRGFDTAHEATAHLSRQLNSWLTQPAQNSELFSRLLMIALWGNQADLSLWPAGDHAQPQYNQLQTSLNNLLINDTEAIVAYLAGYAGKPARFDFIIDNAGYELICDLALTDFCLSSGLVASVVYHLKYHPTFVSDALIQDVRQTISFLAGDSQPDIANFGRRLQAHGEAHRLRLQDHLFWTSPLSFWHMPDEIRQELAQATLLINKGDANYRRLLGDCHWPYTTPLADIVSYLPAPLVALRTLKSEVAAGFTPEQIPLLQKQDPHWLTNGKRGVIQFV
jgi:hypothetical protein